MQFTEVVMQMRSRADWLMTGKLEELATGYTYPLPLHLVSSRIIVRNAAEGRTMLGVLRDALLARGVTGLRPQVRAVDLPRGGRFRIWVDWHEIAPNHQQTGGDAAHSSAVYYCRAVASGFQIEMVDYTRLSMPELNLQVAAASMSA